MSSLKTDREVPVLIEFYTKPGVDPCFSYEFAPDEHEAESKEYLAKAWVIIEEMANQVYSLQDKIPKDFSQVDVQFGIKFVCETGVLIAKAGTEANINVTLTWTRSELKKSSGELNA